MRYSFDGPAVLLRRPTIRAGEVGWKSGVLLEETLAWLVLRGEVVGGRMRGPG